MEGSKAFISLQRLILKWKIICAAELQFTTIHTVRWVGAQPKSSLTESLLKLCERLAIYLPLKYDKDQQEMSEK